MSLLNESISIWGGGVAAALEAYGGSHAKGLIGATAAGLYHSHSNARYKLHLRPIPQLLAMLDP